MAEIRNVILAIQLIAIYQGKIDFSEFDDLCVYHFEKTICKNDYDNGTICGFNGFLTTQEDTVDFIVKAPNPKIQNDDRYCEELTDEQIEILDSLKEGDVVVLDAFLTTECRYGYHELYSYYTRIKGIKKYDEKDAADKIRAMVSRMPLKYD